MQPRRPLSLVAGGAREPRPGRRDRGRPEFPRRPRLRRRRGGRTRLLRRPAPVRTVRGDRGARERGARDPPRRSRRLRRCRRRGGASPPRAGADGACVRAVQAAARSDRKASPGRARPRRLPARPLRLLQQDGRPLPRPRARASRPATPSSSRWRSPSGWPRPSPTAPITSATSPSPTADGRPLPRPRARASRRATPSSSPWRSRERLARAEPDRADYQRDLSVSYEQMGDLYRALGQGEQAPRRLPQVPGDRRAAGPRRARPRRLPARPLRLLHQDGRPLHALGQGEQAPTPSSSPWRSPSGWLAPSPTAPITSATSPSPTSGWGTSTARSARGRARARLPQVPGDRRAAGPRSPTAHYQRASPSPTSGWATSTAHSVRGEAGPPSSAGHPRAAGPVGPTAPITRWSWRSP